MTFRTWLAALALIVSLPACGANTAPATVNAPCPVSSRSPVVQSPGTRVPPLRHVWLFVLENRSCGEIIGNSEAPYLNRLASTYGLAARYYAPTHPSLPDYLALVAGSTMGCVDQCESPLSGQSLAGQLREAGLSWAAYFEGLPRRGYTGDDSDGYVTRHNPFVAFQEVLDSPQMRSSLRPMTEFLPSLADPPAFSFIVANNDHNMHDGTIREGDSWIRAHVSPILGSPAFADHGVIFITWDEGAESDTSGCCLPGIHGGQVATIVIAGERGRGVISTVPHTTYSLLRTIEDGFGLPALRMAGLPTVEPMGELWN
jgi:hypothetical protein